MSERTLENVLSGAIEYTQYPPAGEIGSRTADPFVISLTSPLTGDNVIELYAQYSRSQPYQAVDTKWRHLIPQWRFTDLSGNVVTSITADTTAVSSDDVIVGSIGTASFYYIDDMPSLESNPVIIWATLNTDSLDVVEYVTPPDPYIYYYLYDSVIRNESDFQDFIDTVPASGKQINPAEGDSFTLSISPTAALTNIVIAYPETIRALNSVTQDSNDQILQIRDTWKNDPRSRIVLYKGVRYRVYQEVPQLPRTVPDIFYINL